MTLAEILKLASKIARSAVFEDRCEYDCEMLARMYDLTEADARTLQVILHADEPNFKPF